MNTPNLDRIVAMARRRMRTNRALAVAGPALVAAGVLAGLFALVGRVVLLPDVETAALLGAVVLALIAVVVASAVRIPDHWAAWAADRWLQTRDAFSTAVELRGGELRASGGSGVALAERQIEAAEQKASGVDRLPEGPRVPGRWLALGLVAVLAAAGLGLIPNPMDQERARRAAEEALVEDVIEDLREDAAELREAGDPEAERLAEELEALAEELEGMDPSQALEALADKRAELEEQLAEDLASKKTALSGLQQELGRQPLGEGDTVRQQLDALAEKLAEGELSEEETAALAERLQELAEALASGQPELAEALREAADALQRGDQQAASGALSSASGAVGDALRELLDQQALSNAAGSLGDAARRLQDGQAAINRGESPAGQSGDGQGDGQGDGDGDGDGQGDGDGDGDGDGQGDGDGDGDGQGDGDGSGQGSGQGQGGGQTQGGGGGGNPTGSGGQGGDNTGGTPNAGTAGELDLQTVFDPPTGSIDGEDLQLGGNDSGQGEDSTVGESEGQGTRNLRIVPYLDVLADYQDRATRTIERPGFPVELRDLVRSYFDRIGNFQ